MEENISNVIENTSHNCKRIQALGPVKCTKTSEQHEFRILSICYELRVSRYGDPFHFYELNFIIILR